MAPTTTARKPRTATQKRAQTNREAWLTEVVRALRPTFTAAGIDLPPVRVSVGWPGGKRSTKGTTVGQCWSPAAASDAKAQIFISPTVSDGRRAIDILAHELCHAADRNEHGHTGPFAKYAKALGLEGKMTETHAGPDLAEKAQALVKRLGKYPHAALAEGLTTGTKKQTTRMLKCTCSCPEPRILRMTQKTIDGGPIICGVCSETFEPEPPADDDDTGQDQDDNRQPFTGHTAYTINKCRCVGFCHC